MPKAVVSTIAHDRPGLVSELSAIARENGLNIEDSRMVVMGGEFAVLMTLTEATKHSINSILHSVSMHVPST